MTEKYTISEKFGPNAKEYISQVVAASNLPENVLVIPFLGTPPEDGTKQPFAVISNSPSVHAAIEAYSAGAIRFARLHLDPQVLLERLNLKRTTYGDS